MESDSVFHNLLVSMELLPGLQAALAIPNMNALPVPRANQVFPNSYRVAWVLYISRRKFIRGRGDGTPVGSALRLKDP